MDKFMNLHELKHDDTVLDRKSKWVITYREVMVDHLRDWLPREVMVDHLMDWLPMFHIGIQLRKQFDKLEKELLYCLNTIVFVYRWILSLDI